MSEVRTNQINIFMSKTIEIFGDRIVISLTEITNMANSEISLLFIVTDRHVESGSVALRVIRSDEYQSEIHLVHAKVEVAMLVGDNGSTVRMTQMAQRQGASFDYSQLFQLLKEHYGQIEPSVDLQDHPLLTNTVCDDEQITMQFEELQFSLGTKSAT